MHRLCLASLLFAAFACAQDAPLESVTLDGSHLFKEFVLEIAGLNLGAPMDPAAIEAACARLRDSGIFESISYQWATGPKGGYALTIAVQDQSNMADATIDIPGVDEEEAWKWLTSRYPQFDHFVPKNEAAEAFLIRKLQDRYAPQLAGEKLVARQEADLSDTPPRTIISFQPEKLPQVESIVFTGQKQLTQDDLAEALHKTVQDRGFTERAFRQMAEVNLRRLYEEHGMYRMDMGKIASVKNKQGALAITVPIEEGPQYKLGKVEMAGAGQFAQAMYQAGGFQPGKVANWTEIQTGVYETEKPLKRQGYFDATAKPERVFHDEEKLLDLRLTYNLGPLYRFGQLKIAGLTPELEAQARQLWKMKPGEVFDYAYSNDFFAAFSHAVDARQFARVAAKPQHAPGDHVMDILLSFELKRR